MRKPKQSSLIGLVVLALLVAILARGYWPLPPVKLIVSKETTYFTGPLKPDGSVDYVAAYNDLMGAGVTPDNNMAVSILRALGPSALSEEVRDGVLARLGLALPPDGCYFTALPDYLAANESKYEHLLPPADDVEEETEQDEFREKLSDLMEQLGQPRLRRRTSLQKLANAQLLSANGQPWSAEEYPILADWLEANKGVLDEIVAAKTQSRFFIPAVATMDLAGQDGLDWEGISGLGEALLCRAMLRLSRDDLVGAGEDALATCRLGRLMCIGDTMLVLSGPNVRISGASSVIAIAQTGRLRSDQAAEMLREHRALPPAGSHTRALILRSRLNKLELTAVVWISPTGRAPGGKLGELPGASIDINDVLQRINQSYDAMKEAVSHREIPKRLEICAKLSDCEPLTLRWKKQQTWLRAMKFLFSSSAVKREWVNGFVVEFGKCLFAQRLWMLATREARAEMRDGLARLALALAAHHADHDRFPLALSKLAPDYLSTIPKDLFDGNDLRYESDGRSYKLWSIGADLKDDGGEDHKDIVLKVAG